MDTAATAPGTATGGIAMKLLFVLLVFFFFFYRTLMLKLRWW
jgi:hypothetical protein